jgi:hypothetical protein
MWLVLNIHIIAELRLVVRPVDLRVNLANRRRHITRELLCVAALNWIIVILSARTTITNLREIGLLIVLASLDGLIWILLLHVATFVILRRHSFVIRLPSILRNVTRDLSVTGRLWHSRECRHKAIRRLPADPMVTRVSSRVEVTSTVVRAGNRWRAHNAVRLLLIDRIILLRSIVLLNRKHIWSSVF